MKKLVSKIYGKYSSNFGEYAMVQFVEDLEEGKLPQYLLQDKKIHVGEYFMVKVWRTKEGLLPEVTRMPAPNKRELAIWKQAENLVLTRFENEKNQMEEEFMKLVKDEPVTSKEVKRKKK